MALNNKLTTTAALLAASFAFGSVAYADVCDTPSKLGDMGSFPGEVITIQGSLLGTDQEMLLNTVSCFEKATGAKIQYSGSRDFAALVVADTDSFDAFFIVLIKLNSSSPSINQAKFP